MIQEAESRGRSDRIADDPIQPNPTQPNPIRLLDSMAMVEIKVILANTLLCSPL